MSAEWYYECGGDAHGPVELDELRRLAREGRIGPGTRVHREGEDWVAARQVRGLIEKVAADLPPGGEAVWHPPAPCPDEDYAAPQTTRAGRRAVTAVGASTLAVAALLLLLTVLSGYGSASLIFAGNQAIASDPKSGPWAGCGTFVGAAIVVIGFVLAVVMIVNAALAGGSFAAGAGVLRRRAWARVLALVFSTLTGLYGVGAMLLAGWPMLSSPPPNASEGGGLAAVGGLGLLFVAHALFTWIVLLRREGAAEFRPGRPPPA